MPMVKFIEEKLFCLAIRGKIGMKAYEIVNMKGRGDLAPNPSTQGLLYRIYKIQPWRKGLTPTKKNFYNNFVPAGNPNTPAQQIQRNKMKNAILHWHGLTPAEKLEYKKQGAKLPWTTRDNDIYPHGLTGIAFHNHLFLTGKI